MVEWGKSSLPKQGSSDGSLERAERTAGDNRPALSKMLEEVQDSRRQQRDAKDSGGLTAVDFARRELKHPSENIFKAESGPYRNFDVPKDLRCAIFQSNLAVKDGTLKPNEVTIKVVDFAAKLPGKGYAVQEFKPGQDYPNGTYIIGKGANDGTNTNHVAMVVDGKLIHTKKGEIVNEPIPAKFSEGAYADMKVYIPRKRK